MDIQTLLAQYAFSFSFRAKITKPPSFRNLWE